MSGDLVTIRPNGSDEMCSQQFTNFTDRSVSYDLLGLCILLGVGSIVILGGLCLKGVGQWAQKRFHWGVDRRLAWIEDGSLQLQRVMLETEGIDRWTKLRNDVPICEENG